jgi:hypothetical protein
VVYAAIVMGAGSLCSAAALPPGALDRATPGWWPLAARSASCYNVTRPQVTLGPGALLPLADQEGFAMKFLAGFLQAFDVFAIWQTVLVALGVSVVARVAHRSSLIAMFGLCVVLSRIGALLGAFTG